MAARITAPLPLVLLAALALSAPANAKPKGKTAPPTSTPTATPTSTPTPTATLPSLPPPPTSALPDLEDLPFLSFLPGAETGAASSFFPHLAPAHHEDAEPDAGAAVVVNGGSRYAGLTASQCEGELARRHIPFEHVGEARGVLAPVRLSGAVEGVEFHSMLPAAQRRTSPYEIVDCRLVLALGDFAHILSRYDVVEVVHFSMYRPPGKHETLNGPGRRHTGGLAIDAARFKTKDGRVLDVEKDFHGRIGAKTCGVSEVGLAENAKTLRHFVCEAADARLFNVLLTPDYNWPHRNHFHLEVTAGVRWILVR